VIVNAANEVAIERFVRGEITFGTLSSFILKSYDHFHQTPSSLEEIFSLDEEVRAYTGGLQ
jgi:1-deoxy-D-xylulose-5-phosphate reductoisomerase